MTSAVDAITRTLPPSSWTADPDVLRERSRDRWPLSALRIARGDELVLPDAVLFPRSTDEVATMLRLATSSRTPVVPRGGGSGVCGGVRCDGAGWVVLDLTRMDRIVAFDAASDVVTVESGIRGDRLEAFLSERDRTLGHLPQSFALSTVGGWIATSSAGQFSPAFGFIEDRVVGLTAVTGDGVVFSARPAPRSAAAPIIRRLLFGSEGALSVVTEASVLCAPKPRSLLWQSFAYPDFRRSLEAAHLFVRERIGAHVIRGWDPDDARAAFASFGQREGAVGLVGFDADVPGLDDRRGRVAAIARALGGTPLGAELGSHWLEHRLDAVELFERVQGPARALGPGAVLDTLEVAGLWGALDDVYRQVRAALRERATDVRCHFSHVFSSGAALYFTFILRDEDDRAVEERYQQTWDAAMAACLDAGGTITHHHGMGRLRAKYAEQEIGPGSVEVLRRIKAALDPAGILNPGVILPDARDGRHP